MLIRLRRRLLTIGPGLCVAMIVAGLFVFLFTISPYPAGDDPGYHTSVLKYMLLERDVRFEMPYFPQLGQLWGSERFVTTTFLGAFGALTGISDVFKLTIAFAALCAALALVPIYLLMSEWLRMKTPAILGIAYLGFSKFYLANFFEGSFDQYTGLLFVSTVLYAQFRWTASRKNLWLFISLALTAVLYRTHELGFLVALLYIIATGAREVERRYGIKWFIVSTIILMIGVGIVFAIRPAYFTSNATEYPLQQMLSTGEGTPTLALILIGIGVVMLALRRFQFEVFAFGIITLALTQTAYLGVPFYPYRFNVYLLQACALFIAAAVSVLLRQLRKFHVSWSAAFAFLFLPLIVVPQIVHINALGSWITSQDRNPASVILNDDISMFQWIKLNLSDDAVIIAPYKWGYYLPGLANRAVILDNAIGGDARDVRYNLARKAIQVYLEQSAQNAAALAHELSARYVLWDDSLNRFPDRYPGYTQNKFYNSKYFSEKHRVNNTVLYEII